MSLRVPTLLSRGLARTGPESTPLTIEARVGQADSSLGHTASLPYTQSGLENSTAAIIALRQPIVRLAICIGCWWIS